jgi:uncharacterized repeat protein (TIGR01451 family)
VITGTRFASNTGAQRGGGLDVWESATISGTTFELNTATGFGGGLYVDRALTLTNTSFYTNESGTLGGAVYVFGNTSAASTLTDVVVAANRSGDEGGGLALGGPTTITNGLITGNSSTGAAGGGIISTSSLTLINTQVLTNSALTMGGGLRSRGTDASTSGLNVIGGVFRANVANDGGAFHISHPGGNILQGVRILANTARIGGGGIIISGTSTITPTTISLVNNFVAANTAASGGTELTVYGTTQATIAGHHNTFAAASTGVGTAISVGGDAVGDSLTLTNSIFHGYAVGVQTGAQVASATLNGVLWASVTVPTQPGASPITVSGAVTGAAGFVDLATYDYHIVQSSAAFNTGVASTQPTDIDGDARPLYGAPDLGADELNLATDLAITKRVSPAAVAPGDTITYTLTYTNVGTRIAFAPGLTDVIPSTLINLAVSSSGTEITTTAGTSFSWSIADLAPGAGGTITITGQVNNTVAAPVTITNSATIASWVGDPALANNTSEAALQVESAITGLTAQSNSPRPLGTAMAFTATVVSGSNVTYTWDFGDGTTGSGPSTFHAYTAIGIYTARVTATNAINSLTTTLSVEVRDSLITGLNISGPINVSVSTPATYVASLTGGSNVNYAWQLDGAPAGTGASITFTFTDVGSHTILVTATNGSGSVTTSLVVTVGRFQLYLPVQMK